ncbi:hypothetical protein Tco_0357761, partial [Tanacetum coccineum]
LPRGRHMADTWLPRVTWDPLPPRGGGCPMTACHVAALDMLALQVSTRFRVQGLVPDSAGQYEVQVRGYKKKATVIRVFRGF